MVKRAGSFRARTRKSMRKVPRTKGKVPITKLLRTFEINERVVIRQEPAIHNGMPHPKFKNKMGVIKGKRGSSYTVEIKDGNKAKLLIASPVHLVKAR